MSVLATDDMLHVMEWHNGEKEFSPFSDSEMARRQDELRTWMGKNNVDAALFTSYHCINYYSGWLYCYFGRKYGMVITQDAATTIPAGRSEERRVGKGSVSACRYRWENDHKKK